MKNNNNQITFDKIQQPKRFDIYDYQNYVSFVNKCHEFWIDNKTLSIYEARQYFNKAKFFNLREDERFGGFFGYHTCMDVNFSNLIQPSTITIDAINSFDVFKNGNFKRGYVFFEKQQEIKTLFREDKMPNIHFAKLDIYLEDKTRLFNNQIKIKLYQKDNHINVNQYGLPERVYIDQEKINDIKVNKEHLLEINNPQEFQFFAQKGETYMGAKIHPEKPITVQFIGDKMFISSFFDINGERIEGLEANKELSNINKIKEVGIQTIEEIKKEIKNIDKVIVNDFRYFDSIIDSIKTNLTKITDKDTLLRINECLNNNIIACRNLTQHSSDWNERAQKHNIEQIRATFNKLLDILNLPPGYKKIIDIANETSNNKEKINKKEGRNKSYIDWFHKHIVDQTDEEYCQNIIDTFVNNGQTLPTFDVSRFRTYNQQTNLLKHKSAIFWLNEQERRNNALLDFINNDANNNLNTLNMRLQNIRGGKCSWCSGDW